MTDPGSFGPLHPKPKNWDEVFSITACLKGVPISSIEHGRVDWEYDFGGGDMRPCGRQGCEQQHGHGWLVALRGGTYVHVGNDCAKKYANPHLWGSSVGAYQDRIDRDYRNQALLDARNKAQEKLYQIDNWPELNRAIALHASFAREAKGPLLTEIIDRAEKRRSQIEREFKLTEEEIAMRRAMIAVSSPDGRPAPYISTFERRPVGDIAGLGCFRLSKTPARLRESLQRLAETVVKWTPGECDAADAKQLSRSAGNLIPYANDLAESVRLTEVFFGQKNLQTLMKLEIIRRQGIINIEKIGLTEVKVVRHERWGRAA